jgi:plastocyanin
VGLPAGLLVGCDVIAREPNYTVRIDRSHTFQPASLVIAAGSMVAWHNRAPSIHTVTADPSKAQLPERILLPDEAEPFDSGDLYSGQRWMYTFDVPGTYIYFCRYHELNEMLGVITVVA